MDSSLYREIKKLIDDDRGDSYRVRHILDALLNQKQLFNSDRKYIIELLQKYSDDPSVARYFDPNYKPVKNPVVTFADTVDSEQKIVAVKYNYPKKSKKQISLGAKVAIVVSVIFLSIFVIGTNGGTFACYVLEMKNPFCNVVGITIFDTDIDTNIFRLLDIGDSSNCYGTLTEQDGNKERCLDEKRWNLDNIQTLFDSLSLQIKNL